VARESRPGLATAGLRTFRKYICKCAFSVTYSVSLLILNI
jgi:hypothetical protein